jgi:hypothetical protein
MSERSTCASESSGRRGGGRNSLSTVSRTDIDLVRSATCLVGLGCRPGDGLGLQVSGSPPASRIRRVCHSHREISLGYLGTLVTWSSEAPHWAAGAFSSPAEARGEISAVDTTSYAIVGHFRSRCDGAA